MAQPGILDAYSERDSEYLDERYDGDPNHPDLERELLERAAEMAGTTPDKILTDMYFNRRKW